MRRKETRVGRMDEDGPQNPPSLRIAGYVGPARTAAPKAPPGGTGLPNISDYWPDSPARLRNSRQWQAFLPPTVLRDHIDTRPGRRSTDSPLGLPARPTTAEEEPDAADADHRWQQRPVILVGMTAMLVLVGTVLLARPLADSEIRELSASLPAALPTAVIPLEPLPTTAAPTFAAAVPASASRTTASSSSSAAAKPAPKPRSARFEFVDGVTELSVLVMDLGGADYRIAAPGGEEVDAATTFTDGVLRVGADSAGSGAVEVRLSNRITWHLRLSAGVKTLNLDTSAGTVSRIDLDGGAETMNLVLGRLTGVVPIRMTGGVSTWRIHTATRIPARVTVGNGAGNVTVYGRSNGGTGAGTVLGSGDLGSGPALDVTATSGIGSLEIARS